MNTINRIAGTIDEFITLALNKITSTRAIITAVVSFVIALCFPLIAIIIVIIEWNKNCHDEFFIDKKIWLLIIGITYLLNFTNSTIYTAYNLIQTQNGQDKMYIRRTKYIGTVTSVPFYLFFVVWDIIGWIIIHRNKSCVDKSVLHSFFNVYVITLAVITAYVILYRYPAVIMHMRKHRQSYQMLA